MVSETKTVSTGKNLSCVHSSARKEGKKIWDLYCYLFNGVNETEIKIFIESTGSDPSKS
jgi:hypothetical protein